MKTDILNFKRFGAYFLSDMRGNFANYWITAAILACMELIAYVFCGLFGLIINGSWISYPIAGRAIVFFVMLAILVITMPVKCYGKITEKKAGSQFLTLPVSTFEKTASMILSMVIIPAAIILAYLGIDAILCLIDKNCGAPLAQFSASTIMNAMNMSEVPAEICGMKAIMNPALYIDDAIQMILIFLLGAIFFKSNKAAKTILVLIGFSMVMSMASTPIMMHIANSGAWDFDSADAAMRHFGWVLKNAGWIDTLSDTITNLALCTAIFFRVKTLKF